jgi:hypothetical protein
MRANEKPTLLIVGRSLRPALPWPASGASRQGRRRIARDPMTRHHLWLLLIPFVGLLWVPFYNFHDPVLFGFPFFYRYQLAWVTAFLTWIAYRTYSHED